MKAENRQYFTFDITLLAGNDILEWFRQRQSEGRLAEELVALVREKINREVKRPPHPLEAFEGRKSSPNPTLPNNNVSEEATFERLYNWQESNNALLTQDEKKLPKKMFSV